MRGRPVSRIAIAVGRNFIAGPTAVVRRAELIGGILMCLVMVIVFMAGELTPVTLSAVMAISTVLMGAVRLRLAAPSGATLPGKGDAMEAESAQSLLLVAAHIGLFVLLLTAGVISTWLIGVRGGGPGVALGVGIGIVLLTYRVLFPRTPWNQVIREATARED